MTVSQGDDYADRYIFSIFERAMNDRTTLTLPLPAAMSIHESIYDRFRVMIDQGQLQPGARVSSLRALATEPET